MKEALADPNSVYIPPVKASITKQASQTIGYAISSDEYIVVVVAHTPDGLFASTAFEAKGKYKKAYLEKIVMGRRDHEY
ncbi:MAG: hypothetical protein QM571_05440 [Micrococcaceae bacterium]